jgi:hypothetical protein
LGFKLVKKPFRSIQKLFAEQQRVGIQSPTDPTRHPFGWGPAQVGICDRLQIAGSISRTDLGQGSRHVDFCLQQGNPAGGKEGSNQPPSLRRVHAKQALTFRGVFFQKPPEVSGLSLKVFSEADAGAVHAVSVLLPSTVPDRLGERAPIVEAKLDTGKKIPNKCS